MDVAARLIGAITVFAALLTIPSAANAAGINVFYVTPDGVSSGVCLTTETACRLEYVLGLADSTGDRLMLGAGTYNIAYEINLQSDVSIMGVPGGARPIIRSTSNQYGVKVTSGQIRNVIIDTTAPYGVKLESGSDADHIEVQQTNASGVGVQMTGNGVSLVDSVVWSNGVNAVAVNRTGDGTATIRHATIWGEGASATGMRTHGTNGVDNLIGFNCLTPATTPTTAVSNSIMHGGLNDAVSEISGGFSTFCAQGSSTMALVNSIARDSATRRKYGGQLEAATESNLVSDGEGAATALAVDGATGDLRPPAGMPGQDRGLDVGLSTTDVAGFARVIGARSDIGAYEAPSTPTFSGFAAAATSPTSATLSANVTPRGAATTLRATYGAGASPLQTPSLSIGAGIAATDQSITLTGLVPNTAYQASMSATSSTAVDRTASTSTASFNTPAAVSLSPSKAPKTQRAGKGKRRKVYVSTGVNLVCADVAVPCAGTFSITERGGKRAIGSAQVVVKQGQSRMLAVQLNKRGKKAFARKGSKVLVVRFVGGSLGAPRSNLTTQIRVRTR